VPLVLLEDEPVELGDDELEPLVLGVELDDVLLSVEVELELDPDGEGAVVVDGAVLEGGEADGGVPPGRSDTRSVRDSLQAVSRPALSLVGLRDPEAETATGMPPGALDTVRANHYECGVIRPGAKEMRA